MRVLAFVVLVGILLAPGALAHGGHRTTTTARAGDFEVSLDFLGPPLPLARTEMEALVSLVPAFDTSADARDVSEVRARFEGPRGEILDPTLRRENLVHRGDLRLASAGTWRATLLLLPGNVTAEMVFDAWGPSKYEVDSLSSGTIEGDVRVVGQRSRVEFGVSRWEDGALAPVLTDATARVSQWNADGVTLGPGREARLVSPEEGLLALETVFQEPGSYAVHVASSTLGLGYDDRPGFNVTVVPTGLAGAYGIPLETEPPGSSVPATHALVVLAVIAVSSFVARGGRR